MAVSLSGMTLFTDNDNQTWSLTDGADTYNESIQGNNSESWQIRKNEDLTAQANISAALPTGRGIFTIWLKSDVAKFYNNIDILLYTDASNYRTFSIATSAAQNVDGAWRNFALDFVNKGTPTGTYNPASTTILGWRIAAQNVNFRAIINNWCDACYYGTGLTVSGTTDTDSVFAEAAAVDQTTANQYGVLANVDDIIFAQADIDLAGTNLVSDSETLVFKDTPNGYSTYWFDVTGTASLINTSIIAAGAIDYDMDTTGATSFSMSGGTLNGYGQLTMASGQTFDGVVLQSGSNAVVSNALTNCTFNLCGQTSLSGGSLSGCVFNEPNLTANTAAVVTADVASCGAAEFSRGTNGHAVELTATDVTQTWQCIATDGTGNPPTAGQYRTGVVGSGSPITPTNNGDEMLYISSSTGTVTINVATGATIPSVRSAGATVYVESAGVSIDVNVKDQSAANVSGAFVYIDDDLGAVGNIANTTTDANGNITQQSYSGAATSATLRVRKYGFKPFVGTIDLTANSKTNVTLITDPQQT